MERQRLFLQRRKRLATTVIWKRRGRSSFRLRLQIKDYGLTQKVDDHFFFRSILNGALEEIIIKDRLLFSFLRLDFRRYLK